MILFEAQLQGGQVCTAIDLIHYSNHTLTWPSPLGLKSPARGREGLKRQVFGCEVTQGCTRGGTVLCLSPTLCNYKLIILELRTYPIMHCCSAWPGPHCARCALLHIYHHVVHQAAWMHTAIKGSIIIKSHAKHKTNKVFSSWGHFSPFVFWVIK